jgi:hypothetical protein
VKCLAVTAPDGVRSMVNSAGVAFVTAPRYQTSLPG